MKKQLLAGMLLALGGAGAVFAQDLTPTEVTTPSVPKPLALTIKEKIPDSTKYSLPHPPRKDADGKPLSLDNDENNAPQGPTLQALADALNSQQTPVVNKTDQNSGKYYWHPLKDGNYCHYRDGDRQWYGWQTGETFHWILWWSGRFWWRDNYAERWLYFDRGYWWWQGSKALNQVQVLLADGHYHVCDTNGVLGEDLLKTGTEEIVTEPVAKPSPNPTPGAKHGSHHGGHHMGGGGGLPGETGSGTDGD